MAELYDVWAARVIYIFQVLSWGEAGGGSESVI